MTLFYKTWARATEFTQILPYYFTICHIKCRLFSLILAVSMATIEKITTFLYYTPSPLREIPLQKILIFVAICNLKYVSQNPHWKNWYAALLAKGWQILENGKNPKTFPIFCYRMPHATSFIGFYVTNSERAPIILQKKYKSLEHVKMQFSIWPESWFALFFVAIGTLPFVQKAAIWNHGYHHLSSSPNLHAIYCVID